MTDLDIMQTLAVDWGLRCFGAAHIMDDRVRALRCAEEAVELAQACGVDIDTMHQLVDIVYQRPVGDPEQEVGGVLITAAVMAYTLDQSARELMFRELRRCLEKTPEHFHKRNLEKIALGLK